MAIAIALLGAALAVPRPVVPRDLPMPAVDEGAIGRVLAEESALAREIEVELKEKEGDRASALYDLRALGTEFRAYGRAELLAPPGPELVAERTKLRQAVLRAKALGTEKLLALRAYEMTLFLAELARWEKSGHVSDELVGLGGTFLRTAVANGWVDEKRRFTVSAETRGILFKRRWNEILGLATEPFVPSREEDKAFYAFLLAHPWRGATVGTPKGWTPDDTLADRAAALWCLAKVDELAKIDEAYPRDLARGILLLRLGEAEGAVLSLQSHLRAHPDGPHTIRARSYLKAGLEMTAMFNLPH